MQLQFNFEAAKLNPGWHKVHECKGEILLAQGKFAGAQVAYRKALQCIDPNLIERIEYLERKIEKCEKYKGNPDVKYDLEEEVKYYK